MEFTPDFPRLTFFIKHPRLFHYYRLPWAADDMPFTCLSKILGDHVQRSNGAVSNTARSSIPWKLSASIRPMHINRSPMNQTWMMHAASWPRYDLTRVSLLIRPFSRLVTTSWRVASVKYNILPVNIKITNRSIQSLVRYNLTRDRQKHLPSSKYRKGEQRSQIEERNPRGEEQRAGRMIAFIGTWFW